MDCPNDGPKRKCNCLEVPGTKGKGGQDVNFGSGGGVLRAEVKTTIVRLWDGDVHRNTIKDDNLGGWARKKPNKALEVVLSASKIETRRRRFVQGQNLLIYYF